MLTQTDHSRAFTVVVTDPDLFEPGITMAPEGKVPMRLAAQAIG
ncbi:MAG TPA: hypothetical protein VHZ55_21465 [Bryobacteraceae bacterium]|jgi:hypothetical protein|nr:hypothetical protein [Bryobacteraceae bacterium]